MPASKNYMNKAKAIFVAALLIIAGSLSYGQGRGVPDSQVSPFMRFLGHFTVSGSVGYGATFSTHQVAGTSLIQNPGQAPLLFDPSLINNDTITVAYANWMNYPTAVNRVGIDSAAFLLGTDSVPVTFRSVGTSIPIDISVHYTFDRYRIGGGFSFEPYIMGKYKPDVYQGQIQPFKAAFALSTYTRWYFLFGGEIFRTRRYTLVADARVGSYKQAKKHFNPDLIKRSLFFNVGVRFEQSLSEYVRVFVRPSFEFKSYTLTFPESSNAIINKLPALYVSFGLSWRLPDRHKCPVKSCQTQINHHHSGKQYRSRVHPFWKWQNPDYGENYPKLIRYKGKNKRKLAPY